MCNRAELVITLFGQQAGPPTLNHKIFIPSNSDSNDFNPFPQRIILFVTSLQLALFNAGDNNRN